MVSIFTRGTSGLTNTVQLISNNARAVAAPAVPKSIKKIAVAHMPANANLITGKLAATASITGSSSVRAAHSDVKIPDLSFYKQQPSKVSLDVDGQSFREREHARKQRVKTYSYISTASLYVGAGVFARGLVSLFVNNWSPTDDVLALASIEVPLKDIPEGKSVTFKWRGKPLFIRHRTAEEISREESVNLTELRDPQHDTDRATKSKYLIVVGICTHLGCVPVADAGDFGGFYCPCHGSHYDASGRIRKGPAPLNLEVPEHVYLSDDLVKIG